MLKEPSATGWAFEGFTVMRERRLLIAGGSPVPLTSKAFDTLVVLMENRDRVVTKDQLLRQVWPDVDVEEGNLTQQIFLLRKALGETAQQPRCIVTIPGHGYRFTARVNAISGDTAALDVSTSGSAWSPAVSRRAVTFVGTGLALLAVVVLLTIVIGSRWMRRDKADAAVDFTRHIARITESGKATFSAISGDGRYVAFVENDGDQYSLWVKQVGADGRTPLAPRQPLRIAHLSFSPDNKYLYFARRTAAGPMLVLFRVPVLGGPETPILQDVDSPVSFSPDGREFVFLRGAGPESHIVIAAAGGGSERRLAMRTSPLAFSAFAPDWSPDGKFVAAVSIDARNGSGTIVLLPVAGGDGSELHTSANSIGRLRWLPDGSGLLTVMSERREGRLLTRLLGGAIWRIGYPDGGAERLTSDLVEHDLCCVDIRANGSAVASVLNTLVSDVWIAPSDQPDALKKLTSDHPVVSRHSWLPDNDTMVYRDLSGRLNAVDKAGRVVALSLPDGRKAVGSISACGDGRYVVFRAQPGNNIWRVRPDAGGAVRLTSGVNDFNPACSHDGKWVLYASVGPDRPSLWRVSIEGGKPTQLGRDGYDVLPSPRGRMIYYSTDAVNEGADRNRPDRWVVVSSIDLTPLLDLDVPDDISPLPGTMPVWAPDESGLDYVVTRDGVSNIWRQPLSGAPRVQITDFREGQIFSFAWSPNGRWLSLGKGINRSDVVLMSNER